LKELERWAAELKYSATILETGKKQTEAIRLYQKPDIPSSKIMGDMKMSRAAFV
jgi:hypothetical protein